MALSNPKLFGLNILSYLADIENKNLALKSLDLNILDLDVIRGSGATAKLNDWISFSRLKQPIHKAITRYNSESNQFSNLLDNRAGTDNTLFGNLTINGALSGNAVRYRYIKGLNDPTPGVTRTIAFADISTSRVSSWSSSASPVIATSPISYGARVGIASEFSLKFEGTSSETRLKTTITPVQREFNSELPTSEISVLINGTPVKLYAMKGIPLVFEGLFKNFNAKAVINQIPGVAASWKIVNRDNPSDSVSFADRGGITSNISFNSSRTAPRNIQFYYNPDNIQQIEIESAGIDVLPVTVLDNLTRLNLRFNNLKNFPNFTFITPNLKQLLLERNPFDKTEFGDAENRLNANIVAKIPAGLTELNLGECFKGSIDANVLSKFTSLNNLNLGRNGGSSRFYTLCPIPNVSNTCTSYSAYSNDFRTIDPSPGNDVNGNPLKNIKQLDNLSYLNLQSNGQLADSSLETSGFISDKITYVNLTDTLLPIPTMSGKSTLQEYYGAYQRSSGGLFLGNSFKFSNCTSLKTLYLAHTPLSNDRFPKFSNPSLVTLNLSYTNFRGGSNDNGTINDDNVIAEKTFQGTPNLQEFKIISGNLIEEEIANGAFTYTPELTTLVYDSGGGTPGSVPNLNSCTKLVTLNLKNNAFTTGTPNLQASRSTIQKADLQFNKLSGAIPTFKNLPNLTELYLNNNKYTAIGEFINLPKLRFFHCHNQFTDGSSGIGDEIPDFSTGCPSMYELILFNNSFTSYKSGSFASLYKLNQLDISNNNLSVTGLEQIMEDLYKNYTETPRGGVKINIKNALGAGLTINEQILETITLLRAASWTVTL